MTSCSRCRATVPAHARFCSECGTWVVHTAAEDAYTRTSGVPPQPPVAPPPMASTPPPSMPMAIAAMGELETLPASHVARPATQVGRTQPPAAPSTPPAASGRLPSAIASPPQASRPPAAIGGSTQWRTLESGAQRTMPELAEPTLTRGPKTLVDESPGKEPSRSLGRTPRPLGAFLVSYQYEPLGTFWPLGIGTNMVGRAGAGRPDIDVGISDTTVSSEQAFVDIEPKPAQFTHFVTIEDRGSTNGTQVNGRPIAPGTRIPVGHGDRVKFGSFETILVMVPYPAGS